MPPKAKITKESIIATSLALLRESGAEAINARSIATALGCSTQPIFSNFSSMEELEAEVTSAAYDLYYSFLKNEAASGKYPPYKSYGRAYIRFAEEEPNLFKHLFMRDRSGEPFCETEDFRDSVEMLMKSNGISRELAQLIHLEMWVAVHGIASLLVTSFLDFDSELISRMLSDIYNGVRMKHLSEK